jgi:histone H3/H4
MPSISKKSLPRRRVVLRDNQVSRAQVTHLARRSGIKSLNKLAVQETQSITKQVIAEGIVKKAVIVAEHAKRKTVTAEDVKYALRQAGLRAYTGTKSGKRSKKCKSYPKKKSSGKKASVKSAKSGKRKAKKGSRALREMRFYQKSSECVFFSPASFTRLVREIAQDYKGDIRFTSEALDVLQFAVESQAGHLLEAAQKLAIHSGRTTVTPKDVQLVRSLGRKYKEI